MSGVHIGKQQRIIELNGARNLRDVGGYPTIHVASETLPTLIHCAAGKDRTGVAIGVILAAVGTRPDLIAEDYALSEQCLGSDDVRTAREWVPSRGYDWRVWEPVTYSPPERMLYTLGYLDEQYGGVVQYVVKHGLAQSKLTDMKELLTEPTR